ncbi:hypothetical protein DHEL01_v204516 [Diaporthe helianthi]|uniref:Uncharacterized protein n=1 Tax=Diaporthe helianthi TaxID=158607 RepID=A0A2P5I3Q5_DIAHE|nr:hypothetical protein DHEL01_v204516 [Diaporthe helianthi]
MPDSDDDHPINFGSDLSINACVRNCLDGECCDCDDHRREEPDTQGGQNRSPPAPYYQHPTAHQSATSIASSGRGPSQPRPVAKQYQSAQSMQYGTTSDKAARGQAQLEPGAYPNPGPTASPLAGSGYGGIFIAGQYPSGFTTPASSYNDAGADVTPFQQSMGYYRDGSGRLHNGQGQPINEQGQVLVLDQVAAAASTGASSMPQSSPTSASSDVSFQTAPSHHSRSTGGASYAGSRRNGQKGKYKKH